MTAPPIISMLVANSALVGDSLKSIRNIICGTAPLALSLEERANALFKDERVVVRQDWGMTELTCMGTMNDPRLADSPGSVGRALVHQSNTHGGYWKNAEATKEIIVDQDGSRWLNTGDIADVAELETILATHPDIINSSVVGVDIGGSELPRAYIVGRPGTGVTTREIRGWMESKVARYERLDVGIVFVDAIP
ncbi:hypothetical protein FOYG_15743 [Fusarium oxysporum NRRL 32931]|uniref:AMP-dependent synthetase/ligase domain-containing protein n=1 Tax=Fusarium oxysporum NRRL 32931 TaxID=660029 RepID=W9HKT0_FUSOX|nr:hypothetical protein FOYG_15743 [Fusarium oxysporum NRRL 32931]